VSKRKFALLLMLPVIASGAAFADDLTKIVQQDLVTLGYDPGNTEGEATTQTIVAISKFQAENELEVTGEGGRGCPNSCLLAARWAAVKQSLHGAVCCGGTVFPISVLASGAWMGVW
jgi:peptidoglycan hydrolase-like protein with peptidoglycan-binding domain